MVTKRPIKYNHKIYKSIQSLFKLSSQEKAIYLNEISYENARNAFYLCLLAMPVSIIHIVLFAAKIKDVTGIEQQWVYSIISAHLSLLVFAILFGILLYIFFFRWRKINRISRVCSTLMMIYLLVLGAVITAFDQYVTPSITPFLNTTILVSLFFQIRPSLSIIYFAASYIAFYLAISQTQLNPVVLISNQVNGISITAIGLCLSVILWRSKLTRILQRHKITQQNEQLFKSNTEKDKFFSIIAHDLRSPFISISGLSEILTEQVREKDYAGIEEYAQLINQSTISAIDLIDNLMEWSRAHSGRMEFNPGYISLNKLGKESENMFMGALLQKKIKFILDLPENTLVYADPNMIRTILRNLISNAIKFTYPGGQITLKAVKNTQECLISVSDNGVGISKETLEKLFRIDQNNSTAGTQNETGTGLGLILCKELTERHQGRIWGESQPGKGSIFYFSLPYNI